MAGSVAQAAAPRRRYPAGTPQQFVLGATVSASDGECGELRRLIVDPGSLVVTHLVVGARHHRTGGHLIPIGFVKSAWDDVVLHCGLAEVADCDDAETTEIFPAPTGGWAGMGAMGADGRPQVEVRDRVPYGDVEIVSGDRVVASDGVVGHVGGLISRSDDSHVTHVLLEQGHLWGRREVWVPIGAVARVDDGVQLNLCREDITRMPAQTVQSNRSRHHSDHHRTGWGQPTLDVLSATLSALPRD
jgi:hypothetical protein